MGKKRILVENEKYKGPRKDYANGFDGNYKSKYMAGT
jgi:hypothetical protein